MKEHQVKAKTELASEIREKLISQGFKIENEDMDRPWGGFFVIDEGQAQQFIDTYFSGLTLDEVNISGKLSPKILLVAPEKRLSWQYHFRRAETWKVLEGPVGIVRSMDDNQGPVRRYFSDDMVILHKGERHRLVGLDDWGVIAEIWQHLDADHPSDEDDIVRLEDDFGR
ncbi:phosphoheptose isomerase [Balneola sp. MJW-20]|uniref:phosphoheptose isomerase n=1 Tax=Gracilimonas aurantiaca TaxID=3234185 RepID=UPI00346797CB